MNTTTHNHKENPINKKIVEAYKKGIEQERQRLKKEIDELQRFCVGCDCDDNLCDNMGRLNKKCCPDCNHLRFKTYEVLALLEGKEVGNDQ